MTPKEALFFHHAGCTNVLWILMILQVVTLELALLPDAYALTQMLPTSFRSILQIEVEKKKSKYYFNIISVN